VWKSLRQIVCTIISLEAILSKQATTEEINKVGQEIADQKNEMSSTVKSSGELWTLTSSKRLYSRRAIKGKYRIHTDSSTKETYTGSYLRTETSSQVVGAESFGLNQLMRVNSDGSVTVGNVDNDAVKTFSNLAAYKKALEKYSYTCKNVIYF